MRSRYPLLWLKKRGKRRSGSPRWGHSGELLYNGLFVAVGAFAVYWHAASVLAPDWRVRSELASLEPADCTVVRSQVVVRSGKKVPRITVRLPGGPADNRPEPAPVTAKPLGVAEGLATAEEMVALFPEATEVQGWIDPARPGPVVLARPFRWWIWWVLLIPLSLILIGVVGLSRTVLRAGASIERRHTVAQHAGRLDPFSGGRVSLAVATALPPTHDVDDSPGVKLRYRLPIEGASGWRLAGMTVMCVAWNLLVGFLFVGVVSDHLKGQPNWAITIFVAPLAFTGGWLAFSLLREAWTASAVGVTQVEIANHPLIPGQTGGGVVFQAGQFRARALSVSLVCDEIATFCEGTDTRTSTEEVYRELLHRERKFRVEVDRPFEQAFTFTVPADAMHSFASPHNEVRWSIEVRGAPVRWPEFRRRFRLCVYPTDWSAGDEAWRPAGAPAEATA